MWTCPKCFLGFKDEESLCPECGYERAEASLAVQVKEKNKSSTITTSRQVESLMRRYNDAYTQARVIVMAGKIIKVISVLLGAIGILSALNILLNNHFIYRDLSSDEQVFFALSLLLVILAALLYCAGIFVAAQGQLLLASLDSAVNSSPFLDNEHRAKIMSL